MCSLLYSQVGFSEQCPDALTRRSACAALSQLTRAGCRVPEDRLLAAHRALAGSLVASGLPEEGWYSVAEAAVCALYALHPQPAQLCEAVLRSMAKAAMTAIQGGEGTHSSVSDSRLPSFPDNCPRRTSTALKCTASACRTRSWLGTFTRQRPVLVSPQSRTQSHVGQITSHILPAGDEADSALDARALSRFFFVLGQVALQHLVHVETLAKSIRRQAASKEKALAEAASERSASGQAPAQGACRPVETLQCSTA